jgi:hypothetical protein
MRMLALVLNHATEDDDSPKEEVCVRIQDVIR